NIKAGLQLMNTKFSNQSENKTVVGKLLEDCDRLSDLMDSVLAFSRPIDPRLKAINLAILLQKILDRWRTRMKRVNVEGQLLVEADLPMISGDLRSIERVFANLISNAVDAMSENGGTLVIRASVNESLSSKSQIEVTVADNGPGIPEEIKNKIFEPFVTNKEHGTGLGLAITQRMITAHKGSIEVESFPGGTIFTVYLPIDSGV
ncbi:MAG: hypothetical protein JEZ03_15965, partial [Bacteroidales bacterium]|nr:hypothetical protein [Bacteroidales bacterium]